jgi:hypothetical protein
MASSLFEVHTTLGSRFATGNGELAPSRCRPIWSERSYGKWQFHVQYNCSYGEAATISFQRGRSYFTGKWFLTFTVLNVEWRWKHRAIFYGNVGCLPRSGPDAPTKKIQKCVITTGDFLSILQ